MVCETLSNLECAYLLGSQQDVKLLFIIFYCLFFFFVWYYFTEKRIDNLKVQYLVWPVLVSKWMGILYLVFSPVHILLFQSNLDYDIILTWFGLFYMPIITIILLMPFLYVFDKFFIYMGYGSVFEFLKKYREKLI